ncbi:hypothetical protein OBBRIDRAFT_727877 [Obba rivulosa]|uniref:Mixed lineage kinase domain-containing protein n=1 Tax=Obba rivulosa TaxID=1052685 RepID=A0A8E2DN25_9APHY|nr:hypothetical protein OBBRIDRAFT_727877 [Obba rivulosa]
MKSTVFRRVETADVLANAVTALETLKDASAAVGTVPFLGVLFGSALGLIRTVETVRADRERTIRFVRRLSELVEHVDRSIAAHTGAPDDKLESSLAELQSALMRMQKDLEALAKERFLSRFLRRGSISGRLQEHLETLDHVSRSFNIACLIALQAAMNWNAEFDDQQVRNQIRQFITYT